MKMFLSNYWTDRKSTLENICYLESRIFLQPLLQMADRMLMAGSVEGRCPFLDHRIVEFAFSLDDSLRFRDGCGKWTALDKEFPTTLGQDVKIIREREDGECYRACPRCGHELDADHGEWVADFPDRKTHGYLISQLFSPKVDAGEIGAGHTVTALYEIVLQGSDALYMEPSRYSPQTKVTHEHGDELAFVRMRYKLPGGKKSILTEWPLTKRDMTTTIAATSDNFRFSTAVAAFAQLLRGGIYIGDMSYADITALARNARGHDTFGYRGEFIQLVNLAQSLAMANKQAQR